MGKWERGDKEKLRRKKKVYGIIEAQDVLQLIKVLPMCFNHEFFNHLLFYCFTSWIVGHTNPLEESFGVSSMASTVFDVQFLESTHKT